MLPKQFIILAHNISIKHISKFYYRPPFLIYSLGYQVKILLYCQPFLTQDNQKERSNSRQSNNNALLAVRGALFAMGLGFGGQRRQSDGEQNKQFEGYNHKPMHSNNKLYIAIDPPQREKPAAVYDNQKSRCHGSEPEEAHEHLRQHGKQELAYQRSISRSRVNTPMFRTSEQRRSPSPSLSAVTSNQEYFRQMQAAILSENRNLKEHNDFLKSQIQGMFDRQRRFKSNLQLEREKVKYLESLNQYLQQQFNELISKVMVEIECIQKLIDDQRLDTDSLANSNIEIINKKGEMLASETESTINRDLQDLKSKVKEIYDKSWKTMKSEDYLEKKKNSNASSKAKVMQYQQLRKKDPFDNYINLKQDEFENDINEVVLAPTLPMTIIKRDRNDARRNSSNTQSRILE